MNSLIPCIAVVLLGAAQAGARGHWHAVNSGSEQAPMPVQAGAPTTAVRPGISGGLGVCYCSPQDVVDLVNNTSGTVERVPEFKAMVEFFANAVVPLSDDWMLKIDYGYLLGSYNVNTQIGPAEYTVTAHLPSLLIQHVLVDGGVYNLKVGAGGGYHFGKVSKKHFTIDDQYSGKGPGAVLDLEANTAFGEHLFAHLGANARWDFIGELTNESGNPPASAVTGVRTSLTMFGIGARLGFTYYF